MEGAGVGENVRTSLIVHPPNGRLPALVEGAAIHRASLIGGDVPGERPVLALYGGIAKDGPEDRGLSERCLVGFNAGPPFNANRGRIQCQRANHSEQGSCSDNDGNGPRRSHSTA